MYKFKTEKNSPHTHLQKSINPGTYNPTFNLNWRAKQNFSLSLLLLFLHEAKFIFLLTFIYLVIFLSNQVKS